MVFPAATPVTRPVDETVAIVASLDCHVAALVTSCVVPSLSVAVAVNCAALPTIGADPAIAIDDTVEDDVGELPHAAARTAKPRTLKIEAKRTFMTNSLQTGAVGEQALQRECHSNHAPS
jgi:hypothetical protein